MFIEILAYCLLAGIALLAAFQLGRKSCTSSEGDVAKNSRVTRSKVRSSKDPSLECELVVLENHCLRDALQYFRRNAESRPAFDRLLSLYQVERRFPDLSHFRLGPNMFDSINLDWIIFINPTTGELVGHGITTRFAWDQDIASLPGGWQGVVRASYIHSHVEQRQPNTLVGLFIFVEDQFRQQGWANNVIEEMRALAKRNAIQALIIPLRPPLRYKKEYAAMPMAEFAALKRDDGLPLDHWIRLHTRLGARILCASEKSHQHAMSVQDFHVQFSPIPLPESGDMLVERNGEWYKIHVDLERDFVLINQGCVWVRHVL